MLEYTAIGLFGLGIALFLIGLWNPAEKESSEQGSMFSLSACLMLIGIGLKLFFNWRHLFIQLIITERKGYALQRFSLGDEQTIEEVEDALEGSLTVLA